MDFCRRLAFLSSDIQVQVGDKLKVYYGPQDEAKVTYEAKVDAKVNLYCLANQCSFPGC
jgi:hypothetical protein